MLIEYIHMAEGKCRVPTSNRFLAPCDSSLNDVEVLVCARGTEKLGQRDGLFADAATDVQDVMFRFEIAVPDERVQKLIVATTTSTNEPQAAGRNAWIASPSQEVEGIREIRDSANSQASFETGKGALGQNCELQLFSA
jgi:hypothetical protein